MCCLAYEHETYKQALRQLPALGAQVAWKEKKGKIISHNIFRNTVTILTDDRDRVEADGSEVKVLQPGKRRRR